MDYYEDFIDRELTKMEQEVYGGDMPAHNKGVYRSVLKKEIRHEQLQEQYWDRVTRWGEAPVPRND